MKKSVAVILVLAVIGFIILLVTGFDLLTAGILAVLGLFGIGLSPTTKVGKKLAKEMDRIKSAGPGATRRSITDVLRRRRDRKSGRSRKT